MINVNLLPPKHVFSQKEREVRRKILTFVLCLSAVFAVVFGIIIGGNLFFDSRLLALNQEKERYQSQLSELSQLGWNVSSIEFKLAGIKFIRANQEQFSKPLASILQLTSGLVSVNQLDLSSTHGISMTGQAKSKPDLEIFLNKFTQKDPQTDFLRNAVMQGLQQQEGGQFGFLMSATYIIQEN